MFEQINIRAQYLGWPFGAGFQEIAQWLALLEPTYMLSTSQQPISENSNILQIASLLDSSLRKEACQ